MLSVTRQVICKDNFNCAEDGDDEIVHLIKLRAR